MGLVIVVVVWGLGMLLRISRVGFGLDVVLLLLLLLGVVLIGWLVIVFVWGGGGLFFR